MNLKTLRQDIYKALEQAPIEAETVIRACMQVRKELMELDAESLPLSVSPGQLSMAVRQLEEGSLRRSMALAFGPGWERECSGGLKDAALYQEDGRSYGQKWRPLGVLLHIGAGNMPGLSAFSALEGLLTGNVNLVKLPGQGDRVSMWLLNRLVKAEPAIGNFLRIFPISSQNQEQLQALIRLSDGVVVWGGTEAVSALRRLTPPDTRLIEWGHKLSFCYLSPWGLGEAELDQSLRDLAWHMGRTGQRLCSSCQGIFVDTEDPSACEALGRRLLPLLREAQTAWDKQLFPGGGRQKAGLGLQLYTRELELSRRAGHLLRDGLCAVEIKDRPSLSPSLQLCSCWIAPLPRRLLIRRLRPYKGLLQTASLICGEEHKEALTNALVSGGVVRVTQAADMSDPYQGEPHDGEFGMRKLVRRVSWRIE